MTNRTAENIFDKLVDGIVAGKMIPGEPLAEKALAEQFGVSRTPVREALHRLEQSNLAERGSDRLDLMEDVDAVAIVLDHLRHTAHLPFDPVEPIDFRGLRVCHGPESD